jgi:hypothetical protein
VPRALLVAFLGSYVTWALGQCIERLVHGFWTWKPEMWLFAALGILLTEMVLGLPGIVILIRLRKSPVWAYLVFGSLVGLVPLILFAALMINDRLTYDWARITLDGAKPLSQNEIRLIYLNGILISVFDLGTGLYAAAIGAVGGFAFWLSAGQNAKPPSANPITSPSP